MAKACQAVVSRKGNKVTISKRTKSHMSPETIAILVILAAIVYGLGVMFEVRKMQ